MTTLFKSTINIRYSLTAREEVVHSYKTACTIIYYFIPNFLEWTRKKKEIVWVEQSRHVQIVCS
jgi:hypothetical protein